MLDDALLINSAGTEPTVFRHKSRGDFPSGTTAIHICTSTSGDNRRLVIMYNTVHGLQSPNVRATTMECFSGLAAFERDGFRSRNEIRYLRIRVARSSSGFSYDIIRNSGLLWISLGRRARATIRNEKRSLIVKRSPPPSDYLS